MKRLLPILLLLLLALLVACRQREQGGVPEEAIRHNILGTAYLGQQKWAEAEAAFGKALELRPQDPLLLTNLAVAQIQHGRLDEAERQLHEALAVDPDYPYARYNLGLLEEGRGDFQRAAAHFEIVARFDPEDLHTQYYLGSALSRSGRDEEAEKALRAALERDPTHVSTLYGLGRLLLKQGRHEEAARLITLSQHVRSRSGLDEAVGNQYGEQGPFAMGIDYPGEALAAPDEITVRFKTTAQRAGPSTVPPWTLARLQGAGPELLFAEGGKILRLSAKGGSGPGSETAPADAEIRALAAGDVNNDGRVELVALLEEDGGLKPSLLRQDDAGNLTWDLPAGAFSSTAGANPGDQRSRVAAADLLFVDRDHDGDLDLVWCWTRAEGPIQCRVATNDGAAHFAVRSSEDHGFRLQASGPGKLGLAFADLDNDRDVDLVIAEPSGVRFLANQRDGSFLDLSDKAGLGSALAGVGSVVPADMNKDGWMDLVIAEGGAVRLALNRRGRFQAPSSIGQASATLASSSAPVVLDYDNDGFLDLARSANGRVLLQRNLGGGQWQERSEVMDSLAQAVVTPLAGFDADEDGDIDLVVQLPDKILLLLNEGGSANSWIQLDTRGVGDNKFGIGTKIEILAGALRQRFDVTRPLPVHAGLGNRDRVQSARYLWPSGVLQDEVDLAARRRVEIVQLDRKGTSCPLLYVWRDGAWRFVSDFLGGCAIGYQHAPGVLSVPDTDEYVRIEGSLSEDDRGILRLRLNNQLEEVIWFDKVELVLVDHPQTTEVYPNERLMADPPWPEFKLYASDSIRPLAAAHSLDDGSDLSQLLHQSDRRYCDNFELLPYKGYASSHTIELDLGPFARRERVVLLLDGWIDYADSTANIAATQAGLALSPPRLQVADGRGGWTEKSGVMGFPAGLPKTMAVELTDLFPSADHRLRLTTNMRIYWDRARVMLGGAETALRVTRLQPQMAELRFGGYPRETSPDGRKPLAYDPYHLAPSYPWKAHAGAYTAFGEVTALLAALDDRFVTTKHGDEIELRFAASQPVPAGYRRTYLLYADGFGKDMDPNSAANDEVGPVPFHGMPLYPYAADVAPPARPVAPAAARPPRFVLPTPDGLQGAPPQPLLSPPDPDAG